MTRGRALSEANMPADYVERPSNLSVYEFETPPDEVETRKPRPTSKSTGKKASKRKTPSKGFDYFTPVTSAKRKTPKRGRLVLDPVYEEQYVNAFRETCAQKLETPKTKAGRLAIENLSLKTAEKEVKEEFPDDGCRILRSTTRKRRESEASSSGSVKTEPLDDDMRLALKLQTEELSSLARATRSGRASAFTPLAPRGSRLKSDSLTGNFSCS